MVRIPQLVRMPNPSLKTQLLCDNIYVTFEVDSGASVSVADYRIYQQYFGHMQLLASPCRLRGASIAPLQVFGEIMLTMDHRGDWITTSDSKRYISTTDLGS